MTLTDEQKAQFKEAFDAIDTDGSGSVDASELLGLVQAQGCNCTQQQIDSFLAAHDHNDDKQLNFDEFLQLLGTLGF